MTTLLPPKIAAMMAKSFKQTLFSQASQHQKALDKDASKMLDDSEKSKKMDNLASLSENDINVI
jgi:hypothetical protein